MVLQRLRELDWTFREFKAKEGIHALHPYPAMMPAPLARQLITMLTSAGDTVLDPFCGSGTVITEAAALSRPAVGYDINPLALLLAKVKSTILSPDRLQNGLRTIKKAFYEVTPIEPAFYNVEYWFKPQVIANLAKLKAAIAALTDEPVRDFFRVAFCRVVRECSNTRAQEFKLFRIPPERLALHHPDVLLTFERRALENISLMREFRERYGNIAPVDVRFHDSRCPFPLAAGRARLMLTSPPYGDSRTTVAYGQFSRLALQWLDLWEADVDKESLGGRPKQSQAGASGRSPLLQQVWHKVSRIDERRAQEVLAFYDDLLLVCDNIAQAVQPGGFAAFVVANRRVKGTVLETDKILVEHMTTQQFTHVETFHREIVHKRMPLRNSPSNISGESAETMRQEQIVLLRKQGA